MKFIKNKRGDAETEILVTLCVVALLVCLFAFGYFIGKSAAQKAIEATSN